MGDALEALMADMYRVERRFAMERQMAKEGTLFGIGFRTDPNPMFGVFQYTGEIIRTTELDGNGDEGGLVGSQFLFDLGYGFAVDAQQMSNRIRQVDHASTSPNVHARVVNHRGVW